MLGEEKSSPFGVQENSVNEIFLTPKINIFLLFSSPSSGSVVVSHHSLNSHFPVTKEVQHFFLCYWTFGVLCCSVPIKASGPFLHSVA